ncbi:hypothetical protein D3C86_1863710 [compost metagenome]
MMKVPSTVTRTCLVSSVPSGIFTCFFAAATLANTGVSCRETRTYRPISTSTAEKMNGIRQPQLMNCSSLSSHDSSRNVPLAKKKPIGAPNCGNEPYSARLRGGAFSVASNAAPPHSPPRPKP